MVEPEGRTRTLTFAAGSRGAQVSTFAYRAVTAEGRTLRGIEDAASSVALERTLSARGLYALHVTPTRAGPSARQNRRHWRTSCRVDVADAVATLATLSEAGLPLERALDVAVRGAATVQVRAALETARRRIHEGSTLADALAEHGRLFPPIAQGLVRAGERGGHLSRALARLTEHLERERALRSRVLSAMLYPSLLLTVGTGALAVLVFFVLPRFMELLGDAGTPLPRSTMVLLGITAVFSRAWPFLLVAILGLAVFLTAWRRTKAGRDRFDAIVLRVPLVGTLRARNAVARFARTLATLLSGGVPLLPALEIAAGATGETAVAREIDAARSAVRQGERLAVALAAGSAFPYAVVRLIEVGEETGRLEALLERAAGTLEVELERRLERFVTLAEPVLIVAFGLVVGFVALALLQAIYGIHADAF